MLNFINLPPELISTITKFLQICEMPSIRQACQSLNLFIGYEFSQICLNGTNSLRFYNDEQFRNIVKSYASIDASKASKISKCSKASKISRCSKARKRYLIELDLSWCQGITDVSVLNGIHTLNLRATNISNVRELSQAHTLDLSECQGIIDVSPLSGVHTLYLQECMNINNVSDLGDVNALYLQGCTGVVDVSTLGGVHTLELSGCTGIVDVSALGSVHTLDLSWCQVDVSALGDVQELILL